MVSKIKLIKKEIGDFYEKEFGKDLLFVIIYGSWAFRLNNKRLVKSNSFDTFIRLYTDSRENLNFTFNCTMDNRTSFNVDINYSNKLISYPLYNTTNPFNLWVNISPANGSMPNDVYYGWCNVSRIVDGFLRPVKIEWAQHPPSGQVAIYTGTTKCNSTSANCDFSDSILADEITTKSWTIKNILSLKKKS